MRSIDADALVERIKKEQSRFENAGYDEWCNGICLGLDKAIDEINDAPTVDAVPVVHGRGEDIYGHKYCNPRFRCSVCKTKALYVAVQTCLGTWADEQELSSYCPNCGAKMDGEKDG